MRDTGRDSATETLWEVAVEDLHSMASMSQQAIHSLQLMLVDGAPAQPGDRTDARTVIGTIQQASSLATVTANHIENDILPHPPVPEHQGHVPAAYSDAHGWNGGKF